MASKIRHRPMRWEWNSFDATKDGRYLIPTLPPSHHRGRELAGPREQIEGVELLGVGHLQGSLEPTESTSHVRCCGFNLGHDLSPIVNEMEACAVPY